MRLIPTIDQWRAWSLPSKLTAIGTLVGLLSIAFYFLEKVVPIGSVVISWLFSPPGFSYSRGDIEYLSVYRPNEELAGIVALDGPTKEMRTAYRIARNVFEGRHVTTIALRPKKDFVATSDGEPLSICKVLLFRFRDDAGLHPKQQIIDHNYGCDARFVRLSDRIGDAIVAWSWGGNGLMLDLSISLWDRAEFVEVDIEWGWWGEAQYAFADLDGDGVKELVIAKANRWENPPVLTILKLSGDRPLVFRPLDQSTPEFKSYLDQVDAVNDPSLWEWVRPEEVGVKGQDNESNEKP